MLPLAPKGEYPKSLKGLKREKVKVEREKYN